jgi:hypothetical protein
MPPVTRTTNTGEEDATPGTSKQAKLTELSTNFTKEEIEKYIRDRVEEELQKKQSDVTQYPADKLYKSPPFVIPNILEKDKLNGKNFRTWSQKVTLDLTALNRLPFIESDGGNVNVSPGLRVILDAQTLQYIKASVTKSVCTISTTFSARIKP